MITTITLTIVILVTLSLLAFYVRLGRKLERRLKASRARVIELQKCLDASDKRELARAVKSTRKPTLADDAQTIAGVVVRRIGGLG